MDKELNFYKEIVDSIGDYVLVIDRDYRIVFANRALLERCGLKLEDVKGRKCHEFSHHLPLPCHKELSFLICAHKEVFEKKMPASTTHTHKLPDGTEIVLQITGTPLKGEDGEVLYMVEMMRDITDITKRMDDLQELREMFQAIAMTATDAIVVIDDRGLIKYWNPSAERMFGYSEDEALGKELHMIFAPEKYHRAYRNGIRIFGETGMGNVIGKTLEFTAIKKDRTEFPIEVSTSAINIKGRWHAVGIIRDISERVKLNEDLKKRIKELEEFYDIAVSRELRMIELKEEIERLEGEVQRLKSQEGQG